MWQRSCIDQKVTAWPRSVALDVTVADHIVLLGWDAAPSAPSAATPATIAAALAWRTKPRPFPAKLRLSTTGQAICSDSLVSASERLGEPLETERP